MDPIYVRAVKRDVTVPPVKRLVFVQSKKGKNMLAPIFHTAGNKTRYRLDYTNFLEDGMSLTSGTVVVDPAFTATVTDITITAITSLPSQQLAFFMQGGSVNETFTLAVQVVDSRGEIKNDSLPVVIIAP